MSLEKISVIDKIEVLESGQIQVRRADKILEDGVEITPPKYHRHVLAPGDDLTNEEEKVVAVANAVWTPEVIEAYQATLAQMAPTAAPE